MPKYIVGFKHNGNGIDWLHEPINTVSENHIKSAEIEAGPECDAITRQPGIMPYKAGKVPYLQCLQIRIRFIRCNNNLK
jgi:hypothetical protein